MAKRVFITGGTGFVGRALVDALLERGDRPVVLTRDADKGRHELPAGADVVEGDPTVAGEWQQRLAGCDAVCNLAGAPIAGKRWNAHYRQIVHDSRVDTTRLVVEGIVALPEDQRPTVLANASGIDYYPFAEELEDIGRDEDAPVAEGTPPGDTALARICRDWEEEASAARDVDVRVTYMRTALVLGEGGGFLDRFVLPYKLFVGGRLGSGAQWFSWIHRRDAVRGYLFAIDEPSMEGPVNLVAPETIRNAELARALGAAMRRPAWMRVPAFALKAAAGEAAEYLLHGRRAVPTKLEEHGFRFRFPDIDAALADIFG